MAKLKHDGKVVNGSLPLFCIHAFLVVAFVSDKGTIIYSRNNKHN